MAAIDDDVAMPTGGKAERARSAAVEARKRDNTDAYDFWMRRAATHRANGNEIAALECEADARRYKGQ